MPIDVVRPRTYIEAKPMNVIHVFLVITAKRINTQEHIGLQGRHTRTDEALPHTPQFHRRSGCYDGPCPWKKKQEHIEHLISSSFDLDRRF